MDLWGSRQAWQLRSSMPSSLWVSRQGIRKIFSSMMRAHTHKILDTYVCLYIQLYKYSSIYIYMCVCAYVYSCYTIHINIHTYIYIYVKMPSLSLYIYMLHVIYVYATHTYVYTLYLYGVVYIDIYSLQIIYSRIIALDMQMAGERNSAVHPLGPSDDCLTVLPILFGFPK